MRAAMARAGTRTRPRRPARDYVLFAAGGILLVALLAYAMSNSRDGADANAEGPVPVTTFSHVHGLAVNPERPHELLVATHHGLVRRTAEGGWERVGPVQDYMGFSAHPRDGDVFFASGHPAGGGNLGVISSTDGGLTWSRIGLDGVDFHAMTVSAADPNVLWGSYAGRLHRSTDGGATWEVVAQSPPRIASLAASPTERDTLFATTDAGVQRSVDGGATWSVVSELRATGLAIDPSDAQRLFAASAAGVHRSTDGGATWALVPRAFEGRPASVAIDPTDPQRVYVATIESAILRSADGGETWEALHAP